MAETTSFINTPPPKFGADELRARLNDKNWPGAEIVIKQYPALLNLAAGDGLTPIQALIRDGNAEMLVNLLKRNDVKVGDALLHAIEKGDEPIIDTILTEMQKRGLRANGPFEGCFHFKFYTTPLMLACQKENYALVGRFLKQRHVLYIPHGSGCGCDSCAKNHPSSEKLEDKMRRLDFYAAASSLSFVLHQADPFDYAMSFCRYLEKCQSFDSAYKLKYDEMMQNLKEIVTSLISDCDKKELVEIVLNHHGSDFSDQTCVFGYPRVQQALQSHQKPFLSQSVCLSVINEAYLGTWCDTFRCGARIRFGRLAMYTVLYPIAVLISIFSLGRFPRTLRNPAARFITSFSAHVTFLLMLLIFTQIKEPATLGQPTSGIKKAILVYIYSYVFGMWAIFMTDLRRFGLRHLFSVWWRGFDVLFLLFWTATFYAYYDALLHANRHKFEELHRVHWRPLEQQLIYEAWFNWAVIMSIGRLFYFGQVLKQFGSVTISISRCIPTVLQYVIVLFVVLASFAIGMNHLFENYKNDVVERGGTEVMQPIQLTSVFTAARYLYWVFYGYLPPEALAIIVGNAGHGKNRTEKEHNIVAVSGEWMSALYYAVELLLLLKLMVSIMTVEAVDVVDSALMDWNYVRVEIWNEHFQDSRMIPPPFNLIQLLIHGSIYAGRKILRRDSPMSVWDKNYAHPIENAQKGRQYQAVISSLKDRLRLKLDSK